MLLLLLLLEFTFPLGYVQVPLTFKISFNPTLSLLLLLLVMLSDMLLYGQSWLIIKRRLSTLVKTRDWC